MTISSEENATWGDSLYEGQHQGAADSQYAWN